ncbi:MAG TPA: peptide chain release factor N(5)-glutamine methyltransferase [Chloroflexota bacterium]
MTINTNRTIRQALQEAQRRFSAARVAAPALDARVLLRHALGVTDADLFLQLDDPLPAVPAAAFADVVERRLTGEPVAYLIRRREFYGLDFRVSPAVLIPRPETELLVEHAIEALPDGARVVDVGTGSGAIAVAVARRRPEVQLLAVDRSLAACRVALSNVRDHELMDRVNVLCSDLLSAVQAPFHAVLANLPYLRHDELTALATDVQREPQQALDGGPDGLELYRRLLSDLADRRPAPTLVLCEIAPMQAAAMSALVTAALPNHRLRVLVDLAGRARLVEARLEQGVPLPQC